MVAPPRVCVSVPCVCVCVEEKGRAGEGCLLKCRGTICAAAHVFSFAASPNNNEQGVPDWAFFQRYTVSVGTDTITSNGLVAGDQIVIMNDKFGVAVRCVFPKSLYSIGHSVD